MFKFIKKIFLYGIFFPTFGLLGIGIIGMGAWSIVDPAGFEAYQFEQQQKQQEKAQAELLAKQEAERIHAEKMQDPKYAFEFVADKLDSKAFYMTRNYVRSIIKNPKSLDFDNHNTWKVFYTDGTPESAGYIKVVQHFYGQNGFGAEVRSAVEGIFVVNTVDNTLSIKSFTVL